MLVPLSSENGEICSVYFCPGMRLSAYNVGRDAIKLFDNYVCGICFVLSGALSFFADDTVTIQTEGPVLCSSCPALKSFSVRYLGNREGIKAVSIQFVQDRCPIECPIEIQSTISEIKGWHTDRPFLVHKALHEPLTSLTAQILSCPFEGNSRHIYLGGKALELLALSIECIKDTLRTFHLSSLSPCDLERVERARTIMIQSLKKPPCADKLARAVGIHQKRLREIFRRSYGQTVTDYLQEYRLQHAFRLLSHTNLQVSEVAYEVGYSPAHFSTAFKKRFGFNPGEVKKCAR